MPRRGRKKKFKLNLKLDVNPDVIKSVMAISFILAGALSLLSFIAPDYSINEKIQHGLRLYLGYASILLPFISILLGILLVDTIKFKFAQLRVLLGLVGLLGTLSGLFHIFYLDNDAYAHARDGLGGGLIGYKLSQTLADMLSIYGAGLVLLASLIVTLIFLFNVSLDQLFKVILEILQKVRELQPPQLGKKATTSEENITFSTGVPASVEHVEISSKTPAPPSFEVIPSLSAPSVEMPAELGNVGDAGNTSSVPTLPYADKVWELPPLSLLTDAPATPPDTGNVKVRAKIITDTLKSFGVDVTVVDIQPGPSVTQYALDATTGTKISKIVSLQYDLALALASPTGSVRIEAPIPGKSLIGIEVPNNNRVIVDFKSLLTSESMKAVKSKLGIVLGKDVGGKVMVSDIAKMPHLLVAGATGSGKSVFLHSTIFSILYRASPQECKFILIDPKRVELVHYQDIPHLLTPVITDTSKAPAVFKWAVIEMERRYKLFESAKARNIESYNEQSGFQALPYIVIIVDELGEIMVADPAAVEKSIIRLAQLARATGIHLLLSVQRPSTNIITGLIKANIPSRVAFNVASQVDSRVIIDQQGAEKLLGQGDMLFMPPDKPKPSRLQGAFVSDREITNLVSYLKTQGVPPDYKDDIFDVVSNDSTKSVSVGGDAVDALFDEAVDVVKSAGKASASLLQRRLSIGYARAARILDELEEKSIVGPAQGSKPRDVLISSTDVVDEAINQI